MQQPELGRRLSTLRKERNLTQEELVEKSHVSVRTIQRIESGEVLPRMSTVKVLLNALGESYDAFSNKSTQVMDTKQRELLNANRNTLLIAALSGVVYLVLQILLGALDFYWVSEEAMWSSSTNLAYTVMTFM